MALTDENNMVMPVAPMYGNGNGFGNGFGGDGWWILLLFILLGNGAWGNGFGGGMRGADGLYPWMNQAGITANGFQNQLTNDSIMSIRDGVQGLSTQLCNGFGNVSTQLCNGFNGVTNSITGAQSALAQQMYGNQIADMERSFAAQTASTAGMTALQAQLAQCCCDNRQATNDLRYTVATEACADRAAVSDALRDVLTANTAATQRILDQMCQDKIDAKNDTIAQLRQELLYARGQASQDVQTATLRQGQIAEVDALYDRLSNCPVPTVPVYGRQPIFNCGGGCGCGSVA